MERERRKRPRDPEHLDPQRLLRTRGQIRDAIRHGLPEDAVASCCGSFAEWAKENGDEVIGLDRHGADATANDQDPTLGARRMNAVRDALIAAGVAPSRIVVGDFGTEPVACRGDAANCLALTRRGDVHATRR